MAWTLHSQNASHGNYRKVGEYSTKANAKRKMRDCVDYNYAFIKAGDKGRMREEYSVHSNLYEHKIGEFWMTMNI